MKYSLRQFTVAIFFLSIVSLWAQAQTTQPAAADLLPRDPGNVYGKFDNGLSYIIRKNANPPGKVTLYLHLKSGAQNETRQQEGLAHFIEHMAFNGSEHYPPGTLVPSLSALGMKFGNDTNAHTGYVETVYKLTLPDTQPATIQKALTIFADYSSALTFPSSEVDRERGVILEEGRTRNNVQKRLRTAITQNVYPGTRLAGRDVLGDENLIRTWPREEFLAYWNQWYRPELLTLIVSGDIEPDAVIIQARQALGNIKARTPVIEPLKMGLKPFEAARGFVFSDSEQVVAQLSLTCAQPARPKVRTFNDYRREILDEVSEWIVNRRLSDQVLAGTAPFRHARLNTYDMFNETFEANIGIESAPEDWRASLDAVVVALSRAVEHGFTAQEIELAQRGLLASAKWAVRRESTRDSLAVVNTLASEVGYEAPILSAQQKLDLLEASLKDLNAQELHQTLKQNFDSRKYTYVLSLPAPAEGKTLPTGEDVLAVANTAWAKKTEAPTQTAEALSLLAAEPVAGKVSKRERDDDLGITNITFENGVVLHHKFLDKKKDQVLVQITLPGGGLEEILENKGIGAVASAIIDHPATARLSSTAIRNLSAGKNISISGGIGIDTLTIKVIGSPTDLNFGLQLAYALLTDPKLEEPAFDNWRKLTLKAIEARATQAQGQLSEAVAATIYAGDIRFKPLTKELVNQQNREASEAWFKRIASQAAIEVAVIGDIDADQSIQLIGQYLGSLPARKGTLQSLDSLRVLNRADGPYAKSIQFQSITPTAVALTGFIGVDERDPDRRPLALASLILTERMVKRIRVQEQLVYSIGCSNSPGRGLPGVGLFTASAPTDPKNVDKLADTVHELIADFAKTGPTDSEVETAKKQIVNQLKTQVEQPEFWLGQLAELQYRHRPLEELKDLPARFERITREEIQVAISKIAVEKRAIRLNATPLPTSN